MPQLTPSLPLAETLPYRPNYAYEDCTSTTSITISEEINKIGKGDFTDCNGLTAVNVEYNDGC